MTRVDSIFGMIQAQFPAIAAGANRWRLKRWAALVPKIARWSRRC